MSQKKKFVEIKDGDRSFMLPVKGNNVSLDLIQNTFGKNVTGLMYMLDDNKCIAVIDNNFVEIVNDISIYEVVKNIGNY